MKTNRRGSFYLYTSSLVLLSTAIAQGSAEAQCSPFSIPSATITVDGDAGDWSGIDPALTDPQGDDSVSYTGDDIEALYLAQDSENLYLRMDLWENVNTSFANGPPPHEGAYEFTLYNDGTYPGLRFTVAFDFWQTNSQWCLGCNDSGVPAELVGYDLVGVNGSVIEVKTPLSTLGNPTNFDNISAEVNDCCVDSPVALDDMPCVASELVATNSAAVVISRLDDFLYPEAEFGVEFELGLGGGGVTAVTVTVGGTEYDLEDWDGSWENDDDIVFADLAAMQTALDGVWTIETFGSSPGTSTFTLNAATLTDDDFFPTPTNLSPANGEVGVDPGTSFSWTDPTEPATPYLLGVGTDTDHGGDQEVISLEGGIAVGATTWQPAQPLQNGLNESWVFYADANASFISALSGSITLSSHEFAPEGYPADRPLLALASETIVSFTVPEPSLELVQAAALGTLALLIRRRRRRA
jgi:hypothetical protein